MRIVLPPLPLRGGCQCGRVRYEVRAAPFTLYACHCKECQRQSASAFGMSLRVPRDSVRRRGPIRVARRADADAPPVRGLYCEYCGVRVIHDRAGRDTVNMKAGSLDDTSWLRPVGHIWTRSAQPWSRPASGPLVYEGQPSSYGALIEAWTDATR